MTHITAVVPVLNEALNVAELTSRLCASLAKVSEDFTVVIVDDGSTDDTWARLTALSKEEPRIGGVRLTRNFGQHRAITAGLRTADADWVVVLDGDLQDRPEVIPELYAKAQEGFPAVFVERTDRPEGRAYMAAQRLFYAVLRKLTGTAYDGTHGNFSIISRDVVERYNALPETDRFYGGLIDWLGFERASIKAKHGERFAGKPSYNLMKRLRFARNIILSFATRPLDFTLTVGLMVTMGALFFGFVVLVRALLFGYAIQGWASLMVSIYFLGGVQMVMIGMVGLYVGRISDEVKGRPSFVAGEVLKPAANSVTSAAPSQPQRHTGLSVV